MSFVEFDDVTLYYEMHGEGSPLVLIHGASGCHLAFWYQVAVLRHRWMVLVYDQRGFGKSVAKDFDPGDGHAYLHDFERLLDHVGWAERKINLVGNSFGCNIALAYAAKHTDKIEKLVMSNGIGGITSEELDRLHEERVAGFAERRAQLKDAKPQPGSPEALAKSPAEAARFGSLHHAYGPIGKTMIEEMPIETFLFSQLSLESAGPPVPQLEPASKMLAVTEAQASAFDFPVFFVGGDEDPFFPPNVMNAAASCFNAATSTTFPNTGHSSYAHRPKEFTDTLEAFLNT